MEKPVLHHVIKNNWNMVKREKPLNNSKATTGFVNNLKTGFTIFIFRNHLQSQDGMANMNKGELEKQREPSKSHEYKTLDVPLNLMENL